MSHLRHKKIYQTLLILACVGILLAISPDAVHAQGYVAKKAIDILSTVAAIYGILVVLQSLLTIGLGLAGGFLSFAFALNTAINPGQLIIVQQGWLILRDLANGMFILLLLWIAITIIFQLDQLGGKRFLAKIIMVALLINFSLALVSTVFALGNTLAVPFAQKMGLYPDCTDTTCTPAKTNLAELIINNSQIHEVTKAITTHGADTLWKAGLPSPTAPQPRETDDPRGFGQYLGAPPTAHAVVFLAPLLGILMKPLVMTVVVNIAGALATALIAAGIHASGLDAVVLNGIFNMAIASGFLLLTSLAMLSAAIILLLRVVAMVFLGIFAPIAFLGIAFPKFGDKIWSRWIRELFNWAFTAPIFYFLLYLALFMMQTNRSGNEALFASMSFTANFFKMLNLVLFLVFLWAAVYMTRKTAGHFADVALNLGRKAAGFGLGVATGFAARGVARGALRYAPQIEKTMNAIGRTPLGLALGRRTQAYIQKQRKQAEDLDKEYEGMSQASLTAQLRSTKDAQRIAAIGRVAAKENKMEALAGREEDVVKAATRLGLQDPILQKLPHLVTAQNIRAPAGTTDAQAIEKVVDKMNQEDKVKINKDAYTTSPAKNDVLDALWRTSHNNDIEQIGLKNKDLQKAMHERLNNMSVPDLNAFRGTLSPAQDQRLHQYFNGHLANGTGLSWKPRNWDASTRPVTPGPGGALAVNSAYSADTLAGGSYPGTLAVAGGTAPYTWMVRSGSLPPGITLDPRGTFTGTIPAGTAAHTYTFDAEVTDAAGNTAITRITLKVI